MSKLYKLKEYLSLNEAAKWLSLELKDDEIDVSDILDLIISKKLKLSVKPTHSYVKAIFCEIQKPIANLGGMLIYEPEGTDRFIDSVQVDGDITNRLRLIGYTGSLINLKDECWDFPLIGGNKLAIENYKRKLQGENLINSCEGYMYLKGTKIYPKLYHPKNNQLLDKQASMIENYDPVTNFNDDLELVIQRIDLDNFIHSLLQNDSDNFCNEDYQNILFSLKELVCSKAKKWSQDEINNELDNLLKGMSKRRLESMWSMLNKKYRS
ncbi:hypothetical protein H3S75_10555 [Gilliamella sp. B14384G15]|uniref:hypothetical protein n=1 Tax=unclassified Gilliamella TaxID=2685620 RepID=UPI0018DD2C17|nr:MULTISPECIES: hypothetical protein [unclassified Gilliamella]MBI0031672.1 hypothetical protein [Gilliamella sp. B14384G15]MBI0059027.1 hypothetical protein [Gilliamella sp. B14384G12]